MQNFFTKNIIFQLLPAFFSIDTFALLIEAENASSMTAPFAVVANCSGAVYSKCVQVNNVSGNGSAVYKFNLPTTAIYNLYINVLSPNLGSDSVNYQIDLGVIQAFWFPVSSSWQKILVKQVQLSAGAHTLTLTKREVGIRFDEIEFAQNGSSTPPPTSPLPPTPPPSDGGINTGTGGTLLVNDGFEYTGLDLKHWAYSGNNTSVASSAVARSGSKSLYVKLSPADSTNYRSEVNSLHNLYTGHTYCISFSMMPTKWTSYPTSWALVFQTHAVPHNQDWANCISGRNSISLNMNTSGGLSLAVIKNQVKTAAGGAALGQPVATVSSVMNRWNDVVFQYRPSFGNDGIIQTWINGQKIYSQMNLPNMDLYDKCGLPQDPMTILKVGIYKNPADTGTQELYYDNIKIVQDPVTCGAP